jgi:hypothetical protein
LADTNAASAEVATPAGVAFISSRRRAEKRRRAASCASRSLATTWHKTPEPLSNTIKPKPRASPPSTFTSISAIRTASACLAAVISASVSTSSRANTPASTADSSVTKAAPFSLRSESRPATMTS